MIQGRTLWELVERRAQESPDALFLTDEGKRTMTFAQYRSAAERAAGGLAAMGIGEDTAGTGQPPTWIESFVHGFVFPFTHIGGAGLLMAALMAGMTHVIVEAFDPAAVVDLFDREQATLAGAGTVFHQAYLAEARKRAPEKVLQKVRAWIGGGAPKPPQLHYDMKSEIGGVGIVSGYGLTEAPILTMASVDDADDKLANTEGQASPGVDLRFVTLDGDVAAAGEEGEIRAKGPQVCLGYLDSSLDADAFDEERYFRTGDLGFVDAEGYVVITGRLKDVIIRKGENISAKEVEDLLYTHDKVADVAVIGLPDPNLGERCCAVVALRDAGDPLEFEDMVDFLKDKGLMMQKIPEQL